MGVIASATDECIEAREALFDKYRKCIVRNPVLDRKLVSFQGNRGLPYYSWMKYKEGFSAEFVKYVIHTLGGARGVLFDPFAGTGTAVFAASEQQWESIGIELLPIGFFVMDARQASQGIRSQTFSKYIARCESLRWEKLYDPEFRFHHLPITEGAFPPETERAICGFRAYCNGIRNAGVRKLFDLACLSILEEVSFTRKDGQYLRWDYRANKPRVKASFDKGTIASFSKAIREKLVEINDDLSGARSSGLPLYDNDGNGNSRASVDLRKGSCLEFLPAMERHSVDLIVTSPPYCNRYDYTRTYALELAYLGVDADEMKRLRQALLSCTVENKTKRQMLNEFYRARGQEDAYRRVIHVFEQQQALMEVLGILEPLAAAGKLNNVNIPVMVRNYFLEMAFVIYELARILKRGKRLVMVNDNVRYAGEEIPVDLILTDVAERFGLRCEHIWTLGRGKGNSSQQMGAHGRHELRKCVYVWTKE